MNICTLLGAPVVPLPSAIFLVVKEDMQSAKQAAIVVRVLVIPITILVAVWSCPKPVQSKSPSTPTRPPSPSLPRGGARLWGLGASLLPKEKAMSNETERKGGGDSAGGDGNGSPRTPALRSLHRSVMLGDGKDGSGSGGGGTNHILLKIVYADDAEADGGGGITTRNARGEESVAKTTKATTKRKMPIVLFLSGADCPHESYNWLACRLAAEGYCVVLSSCVVNLGPKNFLLSTPFDLDALKDLERYKRAGPSRDGIERILDELRRLSSTKGDDGGAGGPLAGRLDMDRLVVGGHSSGGRTALDLASYDNPFSDRLEGVFSYGASLVNSGKTDGSVLVPGTVLECDATSPPPLLLMGGSNDGISVRLSSSKDPTETIRRTVYEGFAKGRGDVDLVIVKGGNHMLFCDPVDPTCGAVRLDRALDVVGAGCGEDVREALGNLICDFLRNKCGLDCHHDGEGPRADTDADADAHADAGASSPSSVERTFRPENTLPPAMIHLTRSVDGRAPSGVADASRTSTVSPSSDSATPTASPSSSTMRKEGEDGIETMQEQQLQQHLQRIKDGEEEAWHLLSAGLDDWISTIVGKLQLVPSGYVSADSKNFAVGNVTGSIDGWEQGEKGEGKEERRLAVSWAVRYANENRKPDGTSSRSVGFNVWLNADGAPETSCPTSGLVPHLTVHVGVRGGKATLLADLLPRVDPALHPSYVRRYYRGHAGVTASPASSGTSGDGAGAGVIEPLADGGIGDPSVRALRGPNALGLRCDAGSEAGIRSLLAALARHCEAWLAFVGDAMVSVGPGTGTATREPAVDGDEVVSTAAVARRDLAIRLVLRDHERDAGERFFLSTDGDIDDCRDGHGVRDHHREKATLLAVSLSDAMAGPLQRASLL